MNLNSFAINLAKWRPRAIMALTCMAISTLTPAMAAVESNETLPAIGRMPVLPALTLPVGSIAPDAAATGATEPVSDHAKVGVPLTLADMGINWVEYVKDNFSDEDDDAESGSFYEWLIDGQVVENTTVFTPAVEHGGQSLSVRVTPRTNTGDPDIGKTVSSNTIIVRSTFIERFTKPDTILRSWFNANTYCQNMGVGYRLPSLAELVQLHSEMTSASVNNDVCKFYGWPVSQGDNTCGGTHNSYWANDSIDSYTARRFSAYNGYDIDTDKNSGVNVTCIR